MTVPSRRDLENFKLDIDTLADVVNEPADFGGDGIVHSRDGRDLKTLAKIESEIESTVEEEVLEAINDRLDSLGTLNVRGVWASTTAYTENDVVLFNDSSYIAIGDTTGNQPDATTPTVVPKPGVVTGTGTEADPHVISTYGEAFPIHEYLNNHPQDPNARGVTAWFSIRDVGVGDYTVVLDSTPSGKDYDTGLQTRNSSGVVLDRDEEAVAFTPHTHTLNAGTTTAEILFFVRDFSADSETDFTVTITAPDSIKQPPWRLFANPNPFTSADESKLDGIENGATADQTPAEIVAGLEGLTGNARLPASAVRDLPTGGGGGGLTAVISDDTLSGAGTSASPLVVASPFTAEAKSKLAGIADGANRVRARGAYSATTAYTAGDSVIQDGQTYLARYDNTGIAVNGTDFAPADPITGDGTLQSPYILSEYGTEIDINEQLLRHTQGNEVYFRIRDLGVGNYRVKLDTVPTGVQYTTLLRSYSGTTLANRNLEQIVTHRDQPTPHDLTIPVTDNITFLEIRIGDETVAAETEVKITITAPDTAKQPFWDLLAVETPFTAADKTKLDSIGEDGGTVAGFRALGEPLTGLRTRFDYLVTDDSIRLSDTETYWIQVRNTDGTTPTRDHTFIGAGIPRRVQNANATGRGRKIEHDENLDIFIAETGGGRPLIGAESDSPTSVTQLYVATGGAKGAKGDKGDKGDPGATGGGGGITQVGVGTDPIYNVFTYTLDDEDVILQDDALYRLAIRFGSGANVRTFSVTFHGDELYTHSDTPPHVQDTNGPGLVQIPEDERFAYTFGGRTWQFAKAHTGQLAWAWPDAPQAPDGTFSDDTTECGLEIIGVRGGASGTVQSDDTLTGDGSQGNPLKVAIPVPSGGTDGQVLSRTATGYEWATASGGSTLTDAQIGDKAFSNPPTDLTDAEKLAVRNAVGAGSGGGGATGVQLVGRGTDPIYNVFTYTLDDQTIVLQDDALYILSIRYGTGANIDDFPVIFHGRDLPRHVDAPPHVQDSNGPGLVQFPALNRFPVTHNGRTWQFAKAFTGQLAWAWPDAPQTGQGTFGDLTTSCTLERLGVNGLPDSGLATVASDATLTGDGSTGDPLKVAAPIPAGGTAGQILARTASGYEWIAAPSGGGGSGQTEIKSSNFTLDVSGRTNNDINVDTTGLTLDPDDVNNTDKLEFFLKQTTDPEESTSGSIDGETWKTLGNYTGNQLTNSQRIAFESSEAESADIWLGRSSTGLIYAGATNSRLAGTWYLRIWRTPNGAAGSGAATWAQPNNTDKIPASKFDVPPPMSLGTDLPAPADSEFGKIYGIGVEGGTGDDERVEVQSVSYLKKRSANTATMHIGRLLGSAEAYGYSAEDDPDGNFLAGGAIAPEGVAPEIIEQFIVWRIPVQGVDQWFLRVIANVTASSPFSNRAAFRLQWRPVGGTSWNSVTLQRQANQETQAVRVSYISTGLNDNPWQEGSTIEVQFRSQTGANVGVNLFATDAFVGLVDQDNLENHSAVSDARIARQLAAIDGRISAIESLPRTLLGTWERSASSATSSTRNLTSAIANEQESFTSSTLTTTGDLVQKRASESVYTAAGTNLATINGLTQNVHAPDTGDNNRFAWRRENAAYNFFLLRLTDLDDRVIGEQISALEYRPNLLNDDHEPFRGVFVAKVEDRLTLRIGALVTNDSQRLRIYGLSL